MLDTVKVPEQFKQIFQKAEEYVSRYFKEKKETPSKGTIEIFGERYILVRAASMSVDFFETIKNLYKDRGEEEANNIARQFLFDIAHAIGKQDAKSFHNKMKLKTPIEKLSAGPIHFSYSGWAFVDILPESMPTPDENYYLIYDHPFSFESDSWERAGKKSDFPVCIMNAGYSSGWCEESFGISLVASEIMCRAKGNDVCRFIMAHPSKIAGYIRDYLKKEPGLAKKIINYEIPGFFKRKETEDALRKAHSELEQRVEKRTADLARTSEQLKLELSERKRTEETLRIKDSAIDSSINGIVISNLEGYLTYANNAFLKMWGYDEKEVLGKHILKFCQKEKEVAEVIEALQDEGWVGETKAKRKDGSLFDVSFSASMVKDKDGNLICMTASFIDFTKRKQAEEALQESEKKYRNLVENALVGVYKTNLKGDFLYANKALLKILEFESPEEIMSESVVRRYRNIKDRDVLIENLKKKDKVTDYEVELLTKNGKIKDVLLSARLDRDFISGMIIDITDRKHAKEQVQYQLQRLTALRNIDMAITASLDVRVTLNVFLDQVTNVLRIDAATVLLLNPNTLNLEYAASRGFRTQALQHTYLRLGEGHAGRAALEQRTVSIPDLAETLNSLSRSPLLANEGFISYYAVPLIAKGHVSGVLEIFHRAPIDPAQEWLDFLEALAAQAAIAVDNASLFNNLQHSNIDLILAYDTTLEGWSKALDLRDKETEGHSQRVTDMTIKIARAMGVSELELVHVKRGALLHDIGKMGIPDSILLKPGPLTDEEWEIMRKHPVYAHELLSPIAFLRPALDIPYYHHEKWDGTGYPQGLKGEQIPLSARIFAVVDVCDALSSDRPYRPAWPEEKVKEYLRDHAGKHFDQNVVKVFLEMEW